MLGLKDYVGIRGRRKKLWFASWGELCNCIWEERKIGRGSGSAKIQVLSRTLSEPTYSSCVLVTPDIDWFVRSAVQIFMPKSKRGFSVEKKLWKIKILSTIMFSPTTNSPQNTNFNSVHLQGGFMVQIFLKYFLSLFWSYYFGITFNSSRYITRIPPTAFLIIEQVLPLFNCSNPQL